MERVAAHHITVLLLDVGVVVGVVGAGAGEEQVTLGRPADQGLVDELAAVVAVDPRQAKRQPCLDERHRLEYPPVRAVLERDVLRPPGVHVGDGQGAAELALQSWPAAQQQVDLAESRDLVVIPKSDSSSRVLSQPPFAVDMFTRRRVASHCNWAFPSATGKLRYPEKNVRQ